MNPENEQAVVEPEVSESVVETTEPVAEATPSVDDLQKQIDTLKAQKDHWKGKATSVEPTEPVAAPAPEPKKVELSQTDVLAIARSDIHEEDIDRLTKFAALEDITVGEALGHEDWKAIQDRRAESRKVAEASNTGTNPGSPNVSDEAILANAQAGKMPKNEAEMHRMFEAEFAARRK